jgi:hypothetical protein
MKIVKYILKKKTCNLTRVLFSFFKKERKKKKKNLIKIKNLFVNLYKFVILNQENKKLI